MDTHSRKAPLSRGGRAPRRAARLQRLRCPGFFVAVALVLATLTLVAPAMASAAVADHTESGVSPRGTTINLFDYWVSDRDANDQSNPTNWQNEGINAGHTLLFGSGMDKIAGIASYNQWTGTAEPYEGIVSSALGDDGYPVLSTALGGSSLSYLFDDSSFDGKAAYTDVDGLLQVDDEGYYYYNSQANFASFDEEEGAFTLYEMGGVEAAGSSPDGQFFPFNTGDEVFDEARGSLVDNGTTSTDAHINHYFGLSMSTRFVQQDDGYTAPQDEGGREVTYNFSGDDDVWIYIDGVLVGDLGGIHNATSIQINFHDGTVVVYRDGDGSGNNTNNQYDAGETVYERTTIRQLFVEAGVADQYTWNGGTFANDTYHTLDFFYLERGNTDSNMSLKYNLVNIPESGVVKVDQAGEPMSGVQFTLHEADASYRIVEGGTTISAETDAAGEMVFTTENAAGQEMPVTLEQLQDQGDYWVLTEDEVPDGYRSAGEMHLRFEDGVLLSTNEWDTGAWSQPHVTATAPSTICEADNPDRTHDADVGVMFAVVFQKGEDDAWYPVSGDAFEGWSVSDGNDISDVVAAAKADPYQFLLGSDGAYEVTIEDLPGDITTYEYVLATNEGAVEDAQYTVRYYWADAESIDEIDGSTEVVRIDADASDGYEGMERVFSVTLNVPNIKNELSLVKTDEDTGEVLAGVAFSLYADRNLDGTPDSDTPLSTMTTDKDGTLQVYSDVEEEILSTGSYVLVETTPEGYDEETEPIQIVVDGEGVHVNAGTADDNVSVETGIGSLVYSMKGFAAGDDVDSTLHDVRAQAQTASSYTGAATWWTDADAAETHYQYDDASDGLTYVLRNDSVTDNGRATFTADAGWSRLDVRQCMEHEGEDPVENKENLGDQSLNALFTGAVTIRVTNSKTPTTGTLTISKTVTGSGAPSYATFTFDVVLTDEDQNPVTGTFSATTRHADGTEATSDLTFTADGGNLTLGAGDTITINGLPIGTAYAVTEAAKEYYTPSVQPGPGTINDDGSLTAAGEIGATGATVAFANAFTGGSVDYDAGIDLTVSKKLTGRAMAEGEFRVIVDPADDASAQLLGLADASEDKVIDMPADDDGATASVDILSGLDDIAFTAADDGKTFTYTVYEEGPAQNPSDGVTYDEARYTLTIEVSVGDDGVVTVHTAVSNETGTLREMTTTPASQGTLPVATFENVYEAAGALGGAGATAITAHKTLENATLEGDDFTFGVWTLNSAGETVEEVAEGTNDADGTITFSPITYTTASCKQDVAEGVAQEGADGGNTTYTYAYRVVEDTTDFAGAGLSTATAQFDVQVVVTDDGDGTLDVEVAYPQGSGDGLAFVNTYGASAHASLAVGGTKIYEINGLENAPDIEGAYTYTLSGADEDGNPAPLPAQTTATNVNGSFSFGAIDYDIADLDGADAKTFLYTVTEDGDVEGVENDAAAATGKTFTVTLSDNGDGTIAIDAAAQAAAGAQVSFTNEYDADPTDPSDPTDAGLSITKTLTGRAMTDGEFSFTIAAADDYGAAVSPASLTATNTVNEDGTGSVVFDDGFTFSEPGVYRFTISEDEGALGGVDYDRSSYTAQATVEDDGAGSLVVTWKVNDAEGTEVSDITFENTYTAAATAPVELQVQKELQDGTLADGQFTFELSGSDGAPLPEETTATNDAQGKVSFGSVAFDAAGEYDYTVTEVDDGQDGIAYDEDATRTIHVSVTDDGNGQLVAEVSYGEDGSTFVNTALPVDEGGEDEGADEGVSGTSEGLPGTGDLAIAAVAVVAVLGIGAAGAGFAMHRKTRTRA